MIKKFLGCNQRRQDRKRKEWLDNMTDQDRERLNVTRDVFSIETTAEIVEHFGKQFNPKQHGKNKTFRCLVSCTNGVRSNCNKRKRCKQKDSCR